MTTFWYLNKAILLSNPVTGQNTFPIISKLVDDVITISDREIAAAWCQIMQRMKTVIEPTGALTLAAVISNEFNQKYPVTEYRNVAVILCGGNLDLSVVPKMIELSK